MNIIQIGKRLIACFSFARDEEPIPIELNAGDFDRRGSLRTSDGSRTEIVTDQGDAHSGYVCDVSAGGARIWCQKPLPMGERISFRVEFGNHKCYYPSTRAVWERRTEQGFEYGLSYVPVVPGTELLLDDYRYCVLASRQMVAA